jgi:hypothetical protein
MKTNYVNDKYPTAQLRILFNLCAPTYILVHKLPLSPFLLASLLQLGLYTSNFTLHKGSREMRIQLKIIQPKQKENKQKLNGI